MRCQFQPEFDRPSSTIEFEASQSHRPSENDLSDFPRRPDLQSDQYRIVIEVAHFSGLSR